MELKDLQAQLQTTFNELKDMGNRQEAEIKRFGQASEETKTSIANINKAFDEIKGRIDAIETKANRLPMGADGKPADPMAQEKKDAFFKFMRNGLGELSREEKALVQDATGDILVPADLDSEVYRTLSQLNVLRSLARVRNTTSDRIRRIGMNEVTVGWGKIEANVPASQKLANYESSLTPTEAYLYVEDVLGLTKIGEDELEDSDINLQAYLAESFATAFANLEEAGFLKGTGHANGQPEGILNGTTVTRFTTAAAGTLTADDLLKVSYEVAAPYANAGQYLVNRKIELAMRLMKDSQGQYLWQPSLQAGTPTTFNGKPVYNVEAMDSTVATTKEVAIFGDIKSAYQVLDKQQGSIQRLNELYINDGLIGFKYKRRVGGGVVRPAALRVLKVQ
jgi:HK97 family phage major capsid protein